MRFTFGKHVAFVSLQGYSSPCTALEQAAGMSDHAAAFNFNLPDAPESPPVMSDDERGAVKAAEQHRISRPRASTAATAAPLRAAAELTPRTRP